MEAPTPEMEPRPASRSESLLSKWMGITDANSAGFVHGGMVMRLCDEAAGLAALRHCGRRIVTAAMDRMTFLHPVNIGELLICSASRFSRRSSASRRRRSSSSVSARRGGTGIGRPSSPTATIVR